MGKIKLNLVSGSSMEKGLLTAFTAENNTYIVLDNESVGSMGLPIILVCKLLDNKLTKILEQTEWQKVKENLKNIIGGSQINYITVGDILAADDTFFTQLTLPIASFNALKDNYKPVGGEVAPVMSEVAVASEPVAPVMPEVAVAPEPVAPVMPEVTVAPEPVAPVMPEVTVAPESVAPVMPEVTVAPEPVVPVMPEIAVAPEPVVPVMPEVAVAPEPVVPVMPEIAVAPEPVVPVMPEVAVAPEPVVPVMPEVSSADKANINYDEIKAAFMESCENMFDALVNKFKNEE